MKVFLNIAISAAISSVLMATGADAETWEFWVLEALVLALIAVQYIG